MLAGLGVLLLYGAALALLGEVFFRCVRRPGDPILFLLVAFGVSLRMLYFSITPFTMRAYDAASHLDYVRFVARLWRMPLAAGGWEYHQPPLYYVLAAAWLRAGEMLGLDPSSAASHVQGFSLVCSIAAFLIGLLLADRLFPRDRETASFALFAAILAAFPSLVFVTTRISNDALFLPLSFLFLLLLLDWWHHESRRRWMCLSTVVACAILTKTSGVVLLAILLVAACLRPALIRRVRWNRTLTAIIVVLLLAGWYPAFRLLAEPDLRQTVSLGNSRLNPELVVGNRVADYVTFNPVAMARTPFNSTRNEIARRRHFWEFFFRSAFFGEFTFEPQHPIAVGILLAGMASAPMAVAGAVTAWRTRQAAVVPLLLTTGFLLLAALGYRFCFPATPNQDFRFSVLLCVPFAFFFLMAASIRRWRTVVLTVGATSVLLWTMFFVSLAVR